MRARGWLLSVLVTGVLLLPAPVWACPVCWGAIQGPAAEGVNNGIFTMLALVVVVQFGFVAMFVGIWRRARRLRREQERFASADGGVR